MVVAAKTQAPGSPADPGQAGLDSFSVSLAQRSLMALWKLPDVLTPEPRTAVLPQLWRWSEVRELLMRSGELIGTGEADRRVLLLANSGLAPRPATTQSLVAGLQLLMPGELAPTHRHTPAALRFIMEGEGGHTTVDGERTRLRAGDFVTTPNWTWHDHGNDGTEPVVWLDGLDVPFIMAMNQIFYEPYPAEAQPVAKAEGDSIRRYAMGVRPTYETFTGLHSPVLNYSYERIREVLDHLAGTGEGSPYDDVMVEYRNPYTGASVLPTMAAYAQLLRPGTRSQAHRHTSSTIYLVGEGSGQSVIDGQCVEWERNDVFVVPTWAWHEHRNASPSSPAVLFSYTETPILNALGLFREQARGEGGE